jgi:hypothetical protein
MPHLLEMARLADDGETALVASPTGASPLGDAGLASASAAVGEPVVLTRRRTPCTSTPSRCMSSPPRRCGGGRAVPEEKVDCSGDVKVGCCVTDVVASTSHASDDRYDPWRTTRGRWVALGSVWHPTRRGDDAEMTRK